MQFLITAFDRKDSEALARRMSVREKHLEGVRTAKTEGKHLFGGAILDGDGKMTGSVMVVDYPSLEILKKEWLENDPYVTGNVWKEIDIKPFRIAEPFFTNK